MSIDGIRLEAGGELTGVPSICEVGTKATGDGAAEEGNGKGVACEVETLEDRCLDCIDIDRDFLNSSWASGGFGVGTSIGDGSAGEGEGTALEGSDVVLLKGGKGSDSDIDVITPDCFRGLPRPLAPVVVVIFFAGRLLFLAGGCDPSTDESSARSFTRDTEGSRFDGVV